VADTGNYHLCQAQLVAEALRREFCVVRSRVEHFPQELSFPGIGAHCGGARLKPLGWPARVPSWMAKSS